jgi:hypothetical protein
MAPDKRDTLYICFLIATTLGNIILEPCGRNTSSQHTIPQIGATNHPLTAADRFISGYSYFETSLPPAARLCTYTQTLEYRHRAYQLKGLK